MIALHSESNKSKIKHAPKLDKNLPYLDCEKYVRKVLKVPSYRVTLDMQKKHK